MASTTVLLITNVGVFLDSEAQPDLDYAIQALSSELPTELTLASCADTDTELIAKALDAVMALGVERLQLNSNFQGGACAKTS